MIQRNLNTSSNDFYLDDENDLEQFGEFHSIDRIKLEPDAELNEEIYSLNDDDTSNSSQIFCEKVLKDSERQRQQNCTEISSKPTPATTEIRSPEKQQKSSDDKTPASCCKCLKRSYEQMHFLENLEKEEESLMKSTRLDIARSNNLPHVGDSDYNFLVSFLPQLKKMSELQNLQFRAKMTDFMLTIMSQSIGSDSPLQSKI